MENVTKAAQENHPHPVLAELSEHRFSRGEKVRCINHKLSASVGKGTRIPDRHKIKISGVWLEVDGAHLIIVIVVVVGHSI